MIRFSQLLKRLHDQGADFVVIGGVAASLQGSPMGTVDVDVCAPLNDDNLRKIHAAMQGINARFRMRPDQMRLWDDPQRLRGFKNINLATDLGVIDILGELPGVGAFEELQGKTVDFEVGGFTCRVLDIATLIAAKRAAGRPKDLAAIEHLEKIEKFRRERGTSSE